MEEALLLRFRLGGENACCHLDTRSSESGEAFAGDKRVRVFDGGDNAGDACADQRIAAGRRAAVVGAWLQGDEGLRAGGRGAHSI